jgi:hypothetical protein
MDAATLLADLRAAGFALSVSGDRLDVGPGSKLTVQQTDAIRQHRDELFALVRGDLASLAADTPAGPKARWPVAWLL